MIRWIAWRTAGEVTGPGGGPRMSVGFWWHQVSSTTGRALCGATPPAGVAIARAEAPRAPGTSCGHCEYSADWMRAHPHIGGLP